MRVNVTFRDGSQRHVGIKPTYHYCPECDGESPKCWTWDRLLKPDLSTILNNNRFDRTMRLKRWEKDLRTGDYRVVRPWNQGMKFESAFRQWTKRLAILDGLIAGIVDEYIWKEIALVTESWSVVKETMESPWWGTDENFKRNFVNQHPARSFLYHEVPAFVDDGNLLQYETLTRWVRVLEVNVSGWVDANSLPPKDYSGICAIHMVFCYTKTGELVCEVTRNGSLIVTADKAVKMVVAAGEWLSYFEIKDTD